MDQDGVLDLVVATTKGDVYALKGTNGNILKAFPIKIPSILRASFLIFRSNSCAYYTDQSESCRTLSIALLFPRNNLLFLWSFLPTIITFMFTILKCIHCLPLLMIRTCIRRIYIDGYSTSQVLVADLSNSRHMVRLLPSPFTPLGPHSEYYKGVHLHLSSSTAFVFLLHLLSFLDRYLHAYCYRLPSGVLLFSTQELVFYCASLYQAVLLFP